MKLSFIIATRNRASAVKLCLNSIATAFSKAALSDCEIVVVDNGSTDNTREIIAEWARASGLRVHCLFEPRTGKARALNLALRTATGELLAFTDDDCRLDPEHVTDLLRHAAADTKLVLRGGRIELGNPNDLPLTINTSSVRASWSRAENSARRRNFIGTILGCNLTMRRALIDRVGPFNEDFGPGSTIGSCDDAELVFRAYLAGAVLEYVPDMVVFHHHGRNTADAASVLMRRYLIGSGGLYAKFIFRHPYLCRQFVSDSKSALKEIVTGSNTFLPGIGFSHRDKIVWSMRGMARYVSLRASRRLGGVLRSPEQRGTAPLSEAIDYSPSRPEL